MGPTRPPFEAGGPWSGSMSIEEFLAHVKEEVPEEANAIYLTLNKVVGNILREPCETKFRTLKKDNKRVAQKLCSSMAAVSVLLLVGFQDTEEAFHCPLETDLEQMKIAKDLLLDLTMDLDALADTPTSEVRPTSPYFKQEANALDSLLGEPVSNATPLASVTTVPVELLPEDPMECTAPAVEGTSLTLAESVRSLPPRAMSPARLEKPSLKKQSSSRTAGIHDFQKREKPKQHELQQAALEEVKRIQEERYRQFQSDPANRDSEAYSRPPTGCFDSRASTAPSTPGEWLSQESKRLSDNLKGTSEILSDTLNDASRQLGEASKTLGSSIAEVAESLSTKSLGSRRAASAASGPLEACEDEVGPLPGRFRVVGKMGAIVRQGEEKDTPVVDVLVEGTEFVGLDLASCSADRAPRLRLEAPITGWVTLKMGIVERVADEASDEFG